MKISQKILSICSLLDSKKASDIVVFDSSKRQNVVDYFVLCSLESAGQIRGIVDAILEESEKEPLIFGDIQRDGYLLGGWVVLDCEDAFVHLFTKTERARYSIDKIFADGGKAMSYKKLLATLKAQKQKEEVKNKLEQKKRVVQNKLEQKKKYAQDKLEQKKQYAQNKLEQKKKVKEEKKIEKQNQKNKKKEDNKR